MPVVGYLSSRSPKDAEYRVAAFRRGLRQAGYVEGSNVTIEYRWAEGHYDQLPKLASDLVRREVAVICASALNSALAAKSATATIPIIFMISGDPVTVGLVSSISRPGATSPD